MEAVLPKTAEAEAIYDTLIAEEAEPNLLYMRGRLLMAEGRTEEALADFDQAASIFTAWHLGHRETPVPDFEVKQRNPRWPGINTDHLLAALERGLAGVGRYDARIGWSIRSPLDEEYA